jgi:hypothetical protein
MPLQFARFLAKMALSLFNQAPPKGDVMLAHMKVEFAQVWRCLGNIISDDSLWFHVSLLVEREGVGPNSGDTSMISDKDESHCSREGSQMLNADRTSCTCSLTAWSAPRGGYSICMCAMHFFLFR